MFRSRKITIAAVVLLTILTLAAMSEAVQSLARLAVEPLKIFTDALVIVHEKYVEQVNVRDLIYGALEGMLSGLDPHSSFMRPDVLKDISSDMQGKFGGLGIEITKKDNYIMVISPIDDTPATAAGIKPGDYIVKINGVSTRSMPITEAVQKLRGPAGTTVKIHVWRKSWMEPKEMELTRANIEVKTVKHNIPEKGYGYVKITQFNANTADLLGSSLKDLEKMDGGMKGLVLDLRNNPGGLLDQAVRVSNMFIDSGLIVFTRGRNESQNTAARAVKAGSHTGFPMVLLINAGSASASEIVAGCLQDHHRAIIAGERSFGKGSVQTIIPLSDGSGLKLTTAKYFTPNGRDIQAHGIDPDFVVPGDLLAGLDENRRKLLTREQDLERHLQGPEDLQEELPSDTPGDLPGDVEKKKTDSPQDPQLDAALRILKAWPAFSKAAGTSTPPAENN